MKNYLTASFTNHEVKPRSENGPCLQSTLYRMTLVHSNFGNSQPVVFWNWSVCVCWERCANLHSHLTTATALSHCHKQWLCSVAGNQLCHFSRVTTELHNWYANHISWSKSDLCVTVDVRITIQTDQLSSWCVRVLQQTPHTLLAISKSYFLAFYT